MNPESSSTESVNTTMSTLTRTPRESAKQAAPSAQPEGIITETNTISSTEPSPKELVDLGRQPYITELLNAGQAYDTFDVKEQLAEIDAYLQADTRKEYEKNFEELKRLITDDIYQTVESIRDFVRVQQKLRDALQAKKDFEAMDPLDMTTKQLERYINDKSIR